MAEINYRKKRSNLWMHFSPAEEDKAKCDICKNIFSIKGGTTSNLKKHLQLKHPSVVVPESSQYNYKRKVIEREIKTETHVSELSNHSASSIGSTTSSTDLVTDHSVLPMVDTDHVADSTDQDSYPRVNRCDSQSTEVKLEQKRPISRYPIPNMNTIPSDMQGVLDQGQGKVTYARLQHNKRSSTDGKSDQRRHISRFPIPNVNTIPSDMREVIEQAQEKNGFVPNVFKALSHRPDEMRAFVNYYDVVMAIREGGKLTKADKEMIIVAVSAHNNCTYCVIAHSALCRIHSNNTILADQIATNWETAEIEDRQRAILTFAIAVAKCQPLSDQHFKALYKYGLDKEDAWDIGSVVALFSLFNRMAFLTGMVPNEEYYMLGRLPNSANKESRL